MERRARAASVGALAALVVVGGVVAWLVATTPGGTSTSPTTTASGTAPRVPGSLGAPVGTIALAVVGSGEAGASSLAPASSVFHHAGWGTGRDELGRSRPQEGNPEAPMSLAPAPGGGVVVLDQVNGRLVRLDASGKVVDTITTPLRAPQDVAVAKDGSLAVLDRLGDKTVSIVGADGLTKGSLPIVGKGIAEGGAVTGVFVDGTEVYVEREHQQLVKVGDTAGKPADERTEIPGRPMRDGSGFVNAWIESPGTDSVFVSAMNRQPQANRFTRQLRLPFAVNGLVLLDTDRAGTIYLAAFGTRPSASPDGEPAMELVCLEPAHGAPLGETALSPTLGPEETVRELVVLDGGGVLYARRSESGVDVVHVDCRGGF
ncbi:MAG: hypothetical protein NVS3B10_09750 [Polyangiales bacterium]